MGWPGGQSSTTYTLGQRAVEFDGIGRRTKMSFASEDRDGYLNLDGYQVYSCDSTKKWLTKITRDSVMYGAYEYNSDDGRMTRGARAGTTASCDRRRRRDLLYARSLWDVLPDRVKRSDGNYHGQEIRRIRVWAICL